MNSRLINRIMQSGIFPHPFTKRELVETHISYVILGTRFVYKFKKEIRYSFLDFSTLEKRKYYCEREVFLNNRFSRGLYLKAVPVRESENGITIDGTEGTLVDYAVQMKRLKDDRLMSVMLQRHQVTLRHIQALAVMIRKFHEQAEVIHAAFQPEDLASRFNDLRSVSVFLQTALGPDAVTTIEKALRISDTFLRNHHDFFVQRVKDGWIRDGHGDLHARNIFLYAQPILFDCIEFNDEYRRVDVLDEIAFFCMDLEEKGFENFSHAFTGYYFAHARHEFGRREELLFTYYKSYRANVRAKVNALRAMKAEEPGRTKNLDEVKKYLALMDHYLTVLTD